MDDFDALRTAERALWDTLGVRPVEHRIRLPVLEIDVRVQELGSGSPILFVHGGSSWGTSWADLAVSMQSFRCLLLDRPGTGLSDPIPESSRSLSELTKLADILLPDVLDALRLPSAHLVATSFGGWFALRTALVAPDRVRRMAILGWTAGAPVGRLPLALRLGTSPILGSLIGRLPAGPAAVRSIFRSIGQGPALDDGRITPAAIEAYAALLRHTDTFRNEQPYGRLALSRHRRPEMSTVMSDDDRRRISIPILFAWGDADPFGGSDIAGSFAAGFPHARLELLPGAGHAPWLDDPAQTAALVSAFLRE